MQPLKSLIDKNGESYRANCVANKESVARLKAELYISHVAINNVSS
jgi:hypothetical protein